jgi:hypothetical protein
LDDKLVVNGKRGDGGKQPVEGRAVRAGRYKNHVGPPRTLPTYVVFRSRAASSGHWTYVREAIGRIKRQLRDGSAILVRLST